MSLNTETLHPVQQQAILVIANQRMDDHRGALDALKAELTSTGRRAEAYLASSPETVRAQVLATGARTVIAICNTAEIILALRDLNVDIVWDMRKVAADLLKEEFSEEQWGPKRARLLAALTRSETVTNCPQQLCDQLEVEHNIGVRQIGLAEAFRFLGQRIAVLVGSGLGNIMYATPMIRWLAEARNAPVDVIIHGQGGIAVELLARSPHVHRAYPTAAHNSEAHYNVLIITAAAAHLEVPITADQTVRQHKVHDYNLHGRFVSEPEIYMSGLDEVFDDAPYGLNSLPRPFLRDADFVGSNGKVIGFANGIKQGIWAKRQWPHVKTMVDSLVADGYEMRCFGLPEEYVQGATDKTGLSIRDTVYEIAKCDYFIGHDGGITHIAEVLGVPTVWIFGPTVHIKNGPIFRHSRVVSSKLACAPCQFRPDWTRCETPDCMTGIEVADVKSAFNEVREAVDARGRDLRWRAIRSDEVEREFNAAISPGHPAQQAALVAERISGYPRDDRFWAKLVARLLMTGDYAGVADLVRALRSSPTKLGIGMVQLSALIDAIYPFPTPSGLPRKTRGAAVAKTKIAGFLAQFSQYGLRDDERQVIFELLAIVVKKELGDEGISVLLQEALKNSGFSLGFADRLHESCEALAIGEQQKFISTQLHHHKVRMSENPVGTALQQYAESEAALLDADPDELLESGFLRPLAENAPMRFARFSLNLGGTTFDLPHYECIILFSPSHDPRSKLAGSASDLIGFHARQFCSLGLRPIVVSVRSDPTKPVVEFRDSVLHIHASLRWRAQDWKALFDFARPAAAFLYDLTFGSIGLAEDLAFPVLRVSMDGLWDRQGCLHHLAPQLGLDLEAAGNLCSSDIQVDELTRELVTVDAVCGRRNRSRQRFGLILNDWSDLDLARMIVARLPDIQFTLYGTFVDRIATANLDCQGRNKFALAEPGAPNLTGVIQVSRARSNLCVDAIHALAEGLVVVANSSLAGTEFGGGLLLAPSDAHDVESWRETIHSAMREAFTAR